MFDDFAGQWTPVEFARRLGRKPVRRLVAGEPVVLFRDGAGKAAALLDRCPHRGVALSLGRVTEAGHLQCPFHGWEFAGDGRCARVPFNPLDADKRARLGAFALGVREVGGMIWVFTGAADEARGEPIVPDALLDPAFVRFEYAEVWNTHWTRAMENMLDWPHLPFIHRRTIGRGLGRKLRERERAMATTFEPTDTGARIGMRLADDPAGETGATLAWGRPNGMVLDISPPGRRARQHVWCVPVDARRTNMMIVSARDFGRYNPLMRLFDRVALLILTEDRTVLESSDPPQVPHPREEKSVASDEATLAFRRYYLREMRARGEARDAAGGDGAHGEAVVPTSRLTARSA